TTSYAYSSTTGLLSTITDANSHVTDTFAYDTLRRQTSDTDYYSHADSQTYDANGNVATTTDRNGHTTSFTNDALGRRTGQTELITRITESWTVRAAGLLTQSSDGREILSTQAFDGRGLLTAWARAGVGRLWTYDDAGQQIAARSGNGWWTQFGFDALGN